MNINEGMRTYNGKLIYCILMKQDKNNLCVYIGNNGEIKFEDDRYFNFTTFDMDDDAHRVAKEIFLTYLQVGVKTKLLELKQLELILNQLGLLGIIRQTIVDNGSILINNKDEIISETMKRSETLIEQTIEQSKPLIKKMATKCAEDVVNKNVRKIARVKDKGEIENV